MNVSFRAATEAKMWPVTDQISLVFSLAVVDDLPSLLAGQEKSAVDINQSFFQGFLEITTLIIDSGR